MNKDAAKRRLLWPFVCMSAFALPILYVASSGPVLRFAAEYDGFELAVRGYEPLLTRADNPGWEWYAEYLTWWCPLGFVLPVGEPDQNASPRQLVVSGASTDDDEEAMLVLAEIEEATGVPDIRQTAHSLESENDPSVDAEFDGLTRFLKSPKAKLINRNLGYE